MEQFMLLFRGSEVYQKDQPPEVLEVLKTEMINWVVDLLAKGLHVASEPLRRDGKQINGRGRTLTDEPFGQEREIVGGCTIIFSKDIDQAVDIASTCPILDSNATIEIRPIQSVQ